MASSRDAEKENSVLSQGQDTESLATLQGVHCAPCIKAKTGKDWQRMLLQDYTALINDGGG